MYLSLLLPLLLPLIVFVLLVKNGAKKKLLIAAAVIGLIICFVSVAQGNALESAMTSGILNFLLWYIILDVMYRIGTKFTKTKELR